MCNIFDMYICILCNRYIYTLCITLIYYVCLYYVCLDAYMYACIYVCLYTHIPYMYIRTKDRYRYGPLSDWRPVGVLGYDQVAVQAFVLNHLGAYYIYSIVEV